MSAMDEASGSGSGSAPGAIVKEGWLQKRGEHIRNWRDRYFILFDNGDLVGFRTQPERNNYRDPLNNFTVRDCQIMAVDKPRAYAFTIRGLQCTTVIERSFSVDTEKEREEWMAAIQYVSRRLNEAAASTSAQITKAQEFTDLGTSFKNPRKVTLDRFESIKVLGTGAFGKVLLTRDKKTLKLYAMKILKKNHLIKTDKTYQTAIENDVLKTSSHPFLTALRYSFQTVDRIFFVMEYANGGELYFHLSRARSFSEDWTRFYGAEIISALGYLHANGIIYRDLKLENLLLDKDGHIKVADFGLCKVNITYGRTTTTFCGTPEYIAPEIIDNHDYGPAVDWWSTGVLMYEMVCGRHPFYSTDYDKLLYFIVSEEVRFPNKLSAACRALLSGLLTKEPAGRLGAGPDDVKEIMVHPFFANINWQDLVNKKISPPFLPQVSSDTDTRYFAAEFTAESVTLTPPDAAMMMMDDAAGHFAQISFKDECSSAAMSHMSLQSLSLLPQHS